MLLLIHLLVVFQQALHVEMADTPSVVMNRRSFTIDWENDTFLKDGKPFRYISGTIHYFRVPGCYWEDRLRKMKAAGLNAVETYIAWQVHEPEEGKYYFTENANLLQFLQIAHDLGLLVILRPGPFIDAERDFGGLPTWLLKHENITLRTSDKVFLDEVDKWFSHLLPMIKPFTYENGGPIIMAQVENEYGSYFACDKEYLRFLKNKLQTYLGKNLILFTVDTAFSEKEILCGGLEDVFKTVDFGSNTDISTAFNILRKIQPKGPLVNTEFYTGWLDHWGEKHQTRKTELIATALDKILSLGASVNMYMFEGGTNFAFWNGAEILRDGRYAPEPTSYDYDAPLSESGNFTEKYWAIREVIAKHAPHQVGDVPKPSITISYGAVAMTKALSLPDSLTKLVPDGPVHSVGPKTMESLGQGYGYMLYRTEIPAVDDEKMILIIENIRDRAIVMVDSVVQAIFDRNMMVGAEIQHGRLLDILVENQGHVNYKYGSFSSLHDPKGILGNVLLNGKSLENWEIFPLPLTNTGNLSEFMSYENITKVPGFFVGYFLTETIADTFLKTVQWNKGQAFINGINLGRYWSAAGPQLTLYLPGCFLRKPPLKNEILLFETDGISCKDLKECFVEFVAEPEWKTFS